ncbi:hypothetical protein VCR4J2_250711 [Vibrio coralliirubri]|nr:hypothetical protein VCR4J2_250711 [Vibrio coralliirubri]
MYFVHASQLVELWLDTRRQSYIEQFKTKFWLGWHQGDVLLHNAMHFKQVQQLE